MKASLAKAFYSGSPSHGRAAACRQSAPRRAQQAHDGAGVVGRLQDDLSLNLGQSADTFHGVQVVLPLGGVLGNVIQLTQRLERRIY
jgi:hypothetical protein